MSEDPGGTPNGGIGASGRGGRSWAELLGSSLPTGLEKNILEVVLEKDEKGPFLVSEAECARLMSKIGVDQRPGVHVESIQICPSGRGRILITMKKDIQLDKFCRYESFEVTSSGIRSILIKPAAKKEVVVNVKGIHPNTRDSVVMNYLSKFGKLVTNKVVYGVFNDGPLKGIKNGDRAYKIEVKPGENIGSYHVLEGQKVSLKYPGQQQTCGRCHKTPKHCKGGGIAKKCQAEGGARIEFTDYILDLWKSVGYSPAEANLTPDMNVEDDTEENTEKFTPAKYPVATNDIFCGVSISRYPKDIDQGQIVEMLCRLGLPESKKDNIIIKNNGYVTVKNLNEEESKLLIDAIHGKVFFDRKMFCNGIVPLTPEKQSDSFVTPPSAPSTNPTTALLGQPASLSSTPPVQSATGPGGTPATSLSASTTQPSAALICPPAPTDYKATPASATASEFRGIYTPGESWTTDPKQSLNFDDNLGVVRRHSLSLTSRTPPRNSIAADIMNSQVYKIPCMDPTDSRAKLLIDDLKGLTERLSDFNSCISDSSRDESINDSEKETENSNKTETNVTMNERKRSRKKKRKNSLTPNKDFFLKKQNTA